MEPFGNSSLTLHFPSHPSLQSSFQVLPVQPLRSILIHLFLSFSIATSQSHPLASLTWARASIPADVPTTIQLPGILPSSTAGLKLLQKLPTAFRTMEPEMPYVISPLCPCWTSSFPLWAPAALAFSGFLKHTKLSHAHFLLSFLCETDPTSPLGVGLNISFSEREFSAHLPWYRFLSGLLLFLYSMHYSWQLIHLFTQCTFLSLPLYLGSSKCEKSTQHLLRNTKGRVWTLC